MLTFLRKKFWMLATLLIVAWATINTKIVYSFMSQKAFSTTVEALAWSVGSEARLVWLLERQGFKIGRVADTNWGRAAMKSLYSDCDFSVSNLSDYRDCQNHEFAEFTQELGYDPEGLATFAYTETITYYFGICERNLLIIWIARPAQIEHPRASSSWSCL